MPRTSNLRQLITSLKGNIFDGLKETVAVWVIRHKFGQYNGFARADPRIAAIVSGVPLAADFDMATLSAPRVPLALVTAQQDKFLVPRFHSEVVLRACSACERLADFPTGGHGALLSPLPPGLSGVAAELLNNPSGFDPRRFLK